MGSMTENIADKAINDTRIVKQFTNPVKEPIDSDINLFDLLDNRAKRDPEGAMIEYKGDDGTWHPYSAQVFRDMVIDLAKGLVGLGVNKGDSVAIVSRTRWEWTALDMAIMSIGALTVPVYETNSASQVSWIFNDSKVTLAIAEDDGQRDKIESVRDEVPTLRNVFVIEAGGLNAIKTYGESVTDAEFWEYKEASHGDDRATIVYTSGSTGTPKGVELTHRNFAFLVLSALQYMPRAGAWPNRRLLLFLPLSHVFARFLEFFSFGGTISLALSSNMKTMVKDFETFGPTLLLAVPRVYEKVYNAASQRAGTGFAGKMFMRAAENAREWSKAEQKGEQLPITGRIAHAFLRAGGVQEDSHDFRSERRLRHHRRRSDGLRAFPLLQRHRHAGAGRLRHDRNLRPGVCELARGQPHRHHRHADVRYHRRHCRGRRAGGQRTAGVQGLPQQPWGHCPADH